MWPFKVKIERKSEPKSQFAEGYLDGKVCHQEGVDLTWPLRVGTDEYSKGFRTAYYMHAFAIPAESNQESPAGH